MTDQSELNSRAALCRKLAQCEPANRIFWIAEAENWSRLSKQKRKGKERAKIDSGIMVRLRMQSAKFLLILVQQTLRESRAANGARQSIPLSRPPVQREHLCGQ
jgi:hypothetical protein